ncbi:hypothetical protein U0070_021494, partial [Myodes glareolus]
MRANSEHEGRSSDTVSSPLPSLSFGEAAKFYERPTSVKAECQKSGQQAAPPQQFSPAAVVSSGIFSQSLNPFLSAQIKASASIELLTAVTLVTTVICIRSAPYLLPKCTERKTMNLEEVAPPDEAMAILEERGGIHVASLRLSPPPSPFKPIDLGTKQN